MILLRTLWGLSFVLAFSNISTTLAGLYSSRLNNYIPKYWCDGGDPQRQAHMELLMKELGNVHRVKGPSRAEIASAQAKIPDIYSNISSWCLYRARKNSMTGQPVNSISAFQDLVGEFGCSLCHLNAIRAAVKDNQSYALIMEDDISFDTLDYWTTDLQTIIDSLPSDWDHLMLTVHASRGALKTLRKEWDDRNRPIFLPTSGVVRQRSVILHSTGAYVISRQGMEKILRRFPEGGHIVPCWVTSPNTCIDFTSDNCLFSDRDGSAHGRLWNRYVTTPVLMIDSQQVSSQSLRAKGRVAGRYHIVSYTLVMEWLASNNQSRTSS